MRAEDLGFEHTIEVHELPTTEGSFVATCNCGWWQGAKDEAAANDLAGAHHSETIGR